MITVKNYKEKAKEIDFSKLPEALQKSHKNYDVMVAHYDSNPTIKKVIDLYLKKLNETLKVSRASKKVEKPKNTNVSEKTKKVEKKPTEKKSKPKKHTKSKTKNKPVPKKVEDLTIEIRLIKRYTLLNGKVKSKKQILIFLASLQTAILKKQIRKTSPFAKEIDHIQDELISLLNFFGKNDDSIIEIYVKETTLKKYKEIASSQKVMPAVRYIARYNRLQGKKDVKRKADKLLKDITNALKTDKIHFYKNEVKEVQKALKNYVCNDTESLKIEEVELNGLVSKKKIKTGSIVASTQFTTDVKFKPMGFTGKWQKLIGNPVKPFSMMTYAEPGQGKSTLNIMLGYYLASKHNKKVLFVADEEKLGYTLQEKIKRLNAAHSNFYVTDEIPDNLKQFDFVFTDSVNSMGLSPQDLSKLRDENPQTSFMYIFQTTKSGSFKGSQEYSHDVDVVVVAENGVARTEKSRFGGNGEIKVY